MQHSSQTQRSRNWCTRVQRAQQRQAALERQRERERLEQTLSGRMILRVRSAYDYVFPQRHQPNFSLTRAIANGVTHLPVIRQIVNYVSDVDLAESVEDFVDSARDLTAQANELRISVEQAVREIVQEPNRWVHLTDQEQFPFRPDESMLTEMTGYIRSWVNILSPTAVQNFLVSINPRFVAPRNTDLTEVQLDRNQENAFSVAHIIGVICVQVLSRASLPQEMGVLLNLVNNYTVNVLHIKILQDAWTQFSEIHAQRQLQRRQAQEQAEAQAQAAAEARAVPDPVAAQPENPQVAEQAQAQFAPATDQASAAQVVRPAQRKADLELQIPPAQAAPTPPSPETIAQRNAVVARAGALRRKTEALADIIITQRESSATSATTLAFLTTVTDTVLSIHDALLQMELSVPTEPAILNEQITIMENEIAEIERQVNTQAE